MHSLQSASQISSDAQPKPRFALGTLVLIFLLSLLGMISLLTIGYFLPQASEKVYWFISRSSGVVAYVLITLGVLWGLVQSGSLFRARISPLLSLGLHSYLNWLGLGLAALHGIILVGDSYVDIDLARVFVPFLSDYRPIPVGLGIVAFYLMLLLSLSFYARPYLGQKNFRTLHYTSFVAFVMVTAHSLLAGTDTDPLWWMYALSLVAVVLLTILRVIGSQQTKARLKVRAVAPADPSRHPWEPVAPAWTVASQAHTAAAQARVARTDRR